MIHIVISIDPSTQFLFGIIENLKTSKIPCNTIEIHPNDDSYSICKSTLSELPRESTILFLGHGQADKLYGGESDNYPKQAIIKRNEMSIFQGQQLIALACNSSDLLKSSFRLAKTNKAIGFGNLPTEMFEIETNRRLAVKEITQETIDKFKNAIVEVISASIIKCYWNYEGDLTTIKDYIILLINKKINWAILNERDRNLADLLFKMRTEISIY